MEVKLLKEEYLKSSELYADFMNDQVTKTEENFSDEIVILDREPEFPIYLNISNNEDRINDYIKALSVIDDYYLTLPRNIHFNGNFWQSYLLINKRDYVIREYPQVLDSESHFRNVIMKKFDWENYIYKCVLAAQYIGDNTAKGDREKYYRLVAENLDVYNYIIKYSIFRNDKFVINILDIIYDNDLSDILKAQIKGREDLGEDERVGRRVIFELNKSYPVLMAPMLGKEELEKVFMINLEKYYIAENVGD